MSDSTETILRKLVHKSPINTHTQSPYVTQTYQNVFDLISFSISPTFQQNNTQAHSLPSNTGLVWSESLPTPGTWLTQATLHPITLPQQHQQQKSRFTLSLAVTSAYFNHFWWQIYRWEGLVAAVLNNTVGMRREVGRYAKRDRETSQAGTFKLGRRILLSLVYRAWLFTFHKPYI